MMLSLQDYIDTCPEVQKDAFLKFIQIIDKNTPVGFEKCINYKMVGRVIPHSLYPEGYHCDPTLPLPFINLAYRKSSLNLYHMGLYTIPEISDWFEEEYNKLCSKKLDRGKSCVRFKYYDDIPYELIGELVGKITVQERIDTYEKVVKH